MEQILSKYKELTEQIDMLEIERLELKQEILHKMKEEGLEKYGSEQGKIEIRKPYYRKSFNSKLFKSENPFDYEKYITETEVAESVVIRV